MLIGSSNSKVVVLIHHFLPEGTARVGKECNALTNEWREQIIHAGGNNWRKIFNLYAKLAYQLTLASNRVSSWQDYRESLLLKDDGLFQLVCIGDGSLKAQLATYSSDTLVLLTGKKCADAVGVLEKAIWLDTEFAQIEQRNWLVCPYFDYRQLSNTKLDVLVELIQQRTSSFQ